MPCEDADLGLVDRMRSLNVPVASQQVLLSALAGLAAWSVLNPRQFGKALGQSDYLSRPATQAFLAAQQVLDRWPQAQPDTEPGSSGFGFSKKGDV